MCRLWIACGHLSVASFGLEMLWLDEKTYTPPGGQSQKTMFVKQYSDTSSCPLRIWIEQTGVSVPRKTTFRLLVLNRYACEVACNIRLENPINRINFPPLVVHCCIAAFHFNYELCVYASPCGFCFGTEKPYCKVGNGY